MSYEPTHNINVEWMWLIDQVKNGQQIYSRGLPARELVAYQTTTDMRNCVLTVAERKLDYEFMHAEAHWILSGSSLLSHHPRIRANLSKYSDDGNRMSGAYGPMFLEQVRYVVEALLKDSDTRQAVMTLWRQNPRDGRDIPCTVSLQWLVRDNKLHCIATMRSNDAWMGWPYDQFSFSMMSYYIALTLSIGWMKTVLLGNLYTTVGSMHIYDRHLDRASTIVRGKICGGYFDIYKYVINTPDELLTYLGDNRNVPKLTNPQ